MIEFPPRIPIGLVHRAGRVEQQRVTRRGEPVQLIVAEGLSASSVRETRAIADGVVDVVGLVDGHAGGRELMQNIGHLTGGIIGRSSLQPW